MIAPGIQANDASRVKALEEYDIANTPQEQAYNEIALLAKLICKTEVALVTFIDSDMQWFKAHEGTDIDRNTREYALCSHCIHVPEKLMYIPDLQLDPILKNNPMVTGPTNLRFYAGVPLVTPEGYAIGTICVMHTSPKQIDETQKAALLMLRNQVMNLLEWRRANHKLKKREEVLQEVNEHLSRFASAVTHDIKNPLANMVSIAGHLKEECAEQIDDENIQALEYLEESAIRLSEMTEGILAYYRNDHLNRKYEAVDMDENLKSLVKMLSKKHNAAIEIEPMGKFKVNKAGLDRIFSNLITNAIKYNDKSECRIRIGYSEQDNHHCFEVEDNGIGIERKDYQFVFEEFKTLDERNNSIKPGTGLGLAAAKRIAADLGGDIQVQSTPGKGSIFQFSVKKVV